MARTHRKGRPEVRGGTGEEYQDAIWWVIDRECPLKWTSADSALVLLTTQPMVLFLDLWSAMILGILYLSFGGVPYIFREQYGL